MDTYEDPVLLKAVAGRPWPVFAAVLIPVGIVAGTVLSHLEIGWGLLAIVPVMAIAGLILYFQFRGLQVKLAGGKERKKRATQAEYPLIPIGGMVAGAIYFMIVHQQGISDIVAYDWSGIFGMRSNFHAGEPMTETLFTAIGAGGGAGLAISVGWHKARKFLKS